MLGIVGGGETPALPSPGQTRVKCGREEGEKDGQPGTKRRGGVQKCLALLARVLAKAGHTRPARPGQIRVVNRHSYALFFPSAAGASDANDPPWGGTAIT